MKRPSAALVISVVALFVALGGTGYAAFSLPANSVGTRQLKNGAVTSNKLANHSVGAVKLKLSGLTVPHATDASFASEAADASSAGNALNLDGIQPSGWEQKVLVVTAGGSQVGNIPGSSSSYVFAGSPIALTTTGSQTIVASESAALGQTLLRDAHSRGRGDLRPTGGRWGDRADAVLWRHRDGQPDQLRGSVCDVVGRLSGSGDLEGRVLRQEREQHDSQRRRQHGWLGGGGLAGV